MVDGLWETGMHNVAWNILDVTPLWMPADQRGTNVILPQRSGTRAYRRRITQTEVALEMVICGVVDQHDIPWSNPLEGLRQNLLWLAENVVDPPPDGSATRVATLTSPDGLTTMTADVQVLALERGSENEDDLQSAAVLHVLIPLGRFAEPVS